MKPQLQMLHDCIDIIKNDKLNTKDVLADPQTTYFTQLLDWVAVHVGYEAQIVTPAYQMETHEALRRTFDLELLKQDVWDWFGDLALDMGLKLPGTQYTREDIKLFHSIPAGLSAEIAHNPVKDPSCGTGRTILSYHDQRDDMIIYGVEANKISYRVALLNSFIYKMNVFILNAEVNRHNLGIDSQNWLSANQWYPLAFDDLLEN